MKFYQAKEKDMAEKPLHRDTVNTIGIGDLIGSPVVEVCSAIQTNLKVHFVSNVDGDHVNEITKAKLRLRFCDRFKHSQPRDIDEFRNYQKLVFAIGKQEDVAAILSLFPPMFKKVNGNSK
jgi:hypothetical protein